MPCLPGLWQGSQLRPDGQLLAVGNRNSMDPSWMCIPVSGIWLIGLHGNVLRLFIASYLTIPTHCAPTIPNYSWLSQPGAWRVSFASRFWPIFYIKMVSPTSTSVTQVAGALFCTQRLEGTPQLGEQPWVPGRVVWSGKVLRLKVGLWDLISLGGAICMQIVWQGAIFYIISWYLIFEYYSYLIFP